MEILKNSLDYEIDFDSLEEAKKYYYPSDEQDKETKDSDNYFDNIIPEGHLKKWEEYKNEIASVETLEELADVLNKYTDEFDNGSSYYVEEI